MRKKRKSKSKKKIISPTVAKPQVTRRPAIPQLFTLFSHYFKPTLLPPEVEKVLQPYVAYINGQLCIRHHPLRVAYIVPAELEGPRPSSGCYTVYLYNKERGLKTEEDLLTIKIEPSPDKTLSEYILSVLEGN